MLDTPAMWYGGTLTRLASSSSALANSTVPITYDVRWRWRSTAALGAAVVPDVYSSSAMASESLGSGPASPPLAGSVIVIHSAGLTRARPTSPASSRISSSRITSDDGWAASSSWSCSLPRR